MTEWLPFHFSLSCIGEGNGNPLQCSCLGNPRYGRAWWAAIYGVAQSRTRLKWLSSSSSSSKEVMKGGTEEHLMRHQFNSVAQSCPTLCDPMDCSTPGLSITNSLSSLKLMSIESGMPPRHLILCCPLHLLPSIFPSIRVFSKESVLHIRWPEYWSFSFCISPSNDYSGLISLRMDWLDLLAHMPLGS